MITAKTHPQVIGNKLGQAGRIKGVNVLSGTPSRHEGDGDCGGVYDKLSSSLLELIPYTSTLNGKGKRGQNHTKLTTAA